MASIHRTFTGESVDPDDLMPGQYRGARTVAAKATDAKTDEILIAESKAMLTLLGRGTPRGA